MARRRRSSSSASGRKASTTPGSSRWSRGEGWVAVQLVLFALIVASWFVGPDVTLLGLIPAALGFLLAVWASRSLGRSMTALPVPKDGGQLVQEGPYRFLRHPIYVGAALFFGGLSLVFSAYGLVLTAVLALFWVAKARKEERHLLERFPEYAGYRRRTLF
jgi:protein-S-isoprenylcysteine O-methyltransferase Ste14